MILPNTQIEISAMLKLEPELEFIIEKLNSRVNAFCLTKGHTIPALIGLEYQHLSVLFIASKRMGNFWGDSRDCRGAHITVDGCHAGFHSTSYLTWSAAEFSLAIDTAELGELFNAGQGAGKVVLIWVGDTTMTLSHFTIDDGFMDFLYVANQSRHIPRFTPDQDYIDAKLAKFSALLSVNERRFVGADGNPVYVATSCEECVQDNDDVRL